MKDISFILPPTQEIVEGEAALKVGSSGSAPTVVTLTRPIALLILLMLTFRLEVTGTNVTNT